jgi:hypothetical protein
MLYKVALLTLLLHVAIVRSVRALQYQQYHLETLCGMYQDKYTINLKSQPAIISLTSRIKKRMKCHLELRLSANYFGFSVFIDSMKLDNTTGCSRDFLQFGRFVISLCYLYYMYFYISEILLYLHLSRVTEDVVQ